MERLDTCPRMKIGSCAPCVRMADLIDEVAYGARPVGPALAKLRNEVCPRGEEPAVPDIGIKRLNSARFRLRGR